MIGTTNSSKVRIIRRAVEGKINVPEEKFPSAAFGFVGEGVLSSAVGEAVWIPVEVLGYVNLEPFLDINGVVERDSVRVGTDCRVGERDFNEIEEVGVVVDFGGSRRATRPCGAIASLFFDAAGCGV